MKTFIFLISFFFLFSCNKEIENKKITTTSDVQEKPPTKKDIKISTFQDSIFSNDTQYINDSILKGKFKLDISKYELFNPKNNCYPIKLSKKTVHEFYNQGFNQLGDLNGDKKIDSVFVLHALSYCENGDSYYFTDNTIPRMQTESNCCHPESIFSIGDIDEDGGNEIGQYYSSCASAFKSINIWTLKNNKWKQIATFTFFFNNGKYEAFKDFHKLYKKTAKGKFKFLEISDMRANGEAVMEWKTVIMK
ncbi:hypothetical protein [Chryseobacterium luquanense]|uniref:VCBS repeat-containing protein n=1 Tax=Chryseobacterium luquanense TaxID=2983766 RepID=A0ABT3Y4Y0_9FLAO|nr:hypothetical protein [Chryseobacterium luquanense]MCX8533212.1 hypothetical protein [Chryseobacterium luquanense]